jgi:hypothetical protein
MSGRIYLLEQNGALQSLAEQPYASEDFLQTLLADYPVLLAGEQMDEAAPRRRRLHPPRQPRLQPALRPRLHRRQAL